MCGIAGIYHYSRTEAVTGDTLAAMRDCMIHRGPDDSGVYLSSDRTAGFTHRRLSIIDLSQLGRQPMADAAGRFHIVFNGEIYNFAELRTELEKEGVRFRSHSDTEVLLYLYAKRGPDMLGLLRGMFAFVIWDDLERTLFAARDRIGVKPLYFYNRDGRFIFASEIKALLATGHVSRSVHPEAFYHYLSFLTTPAPQTLFNGIRKLPAAHFLLLDSSGRESIRKWWSPFSSPLPIGSEKESTEEVLRLLKDSIRYRMVSDVPFGVFLSGGIDSSTNVALMAEMMDRPVETFSIGFHASDQFNELNYARMVAERFKTNHHEIKIGMQDLMDFLPQLVHHQDEPIADPVCIPVYYVAKLAKQHGVTVCQVGEGSDELFCGYPHWSYLLSLERLRRAYTIIPKPLRELAAFFAKQLEAPSSGRMEYIRRASAGEPVFWGGAEAFFERHKRQLLHHDFQQRAGDANSSTVIASYFQEFVDESSSQDPLNWMTFVDLKLRLPELLLMRVDKMTMAASVEARVPFLDHKLVEYILGIPQAIKVPEFRTKYLLKKALDGIIPAEIIQRPKQGFGVPVADWCRYELGQRIRSTLTTFNNEHRYFDSGELARVLDNMHTMFPWYLFNFALWHEMWIEQKQPDRFLTPC